jgi:NodT family efflux transporter outer membrane factor (OMF) lipoprotein
MFSSMKFGKNKFLYRLLLCVLMASLVSCKTLAPPLEVPMTFSKTGTDHLPEKWWTTLNDPKLDELIAAALKDNFNLQSVWDRLEQSRAVARKKGADIFPKVDARGLVSHTTSKNSGEDTINTDMFSIGVVAGYELDLWDRISSAREAAKLDLLASREDLYASAISLSAEVASVWYGLVEKRGDYLEIVTMRFRQGQVSSADVLQQRQSLESSKEEKIKIESGIKVLEHRLAVLLGKAPGLITIPKNKKLPKLPPLPNTGLPAGLIQKRPDIRSAFLDVQAADKRVAEAIANRFPRISLSAGVDTADSKISDLFQNWIAALAANLLVPIFDGDSRAAEVQRTKAVRSESINKYSQVILNALKEVEDALVQESLQIKRLESQERQSELSKKSVDLIRERYTHGAADFLRLLTTLSNHHNLERNQLAAKRELVEYRINLCRALGGGWEMKRPPNKKLENFRIEIKMPKQEEENTE